MGLVRLPGTRHHFSMLILRSVYSEQTFRENQPLCAHLQMSQIQWTSLQDYFILQRKIFFRQPHKDSLSPKNTRGPTNLLDTANHGVFQGADPFLMLLPQNEPIPGVPSFSPGLLMAFLGSVALLHWTPGGTHLHHSRFGDLNNYHHPNAYLGLESKVSFLFQSQRKFSLSCNQQRFCSLSVSNTIKKQKLKAATNFFPFPMLSQHLSTSRIF